MIIITSSELNGTNYDRRVNNFTFLYSKEIISPKKVMAVDHQFPPIILLTKLTSPGGFLLISSRILMFWLWMKVASLFCHIPSKYLRASSSPSLTQSMICRLMLSTPPHWAKCLPSSLLIFIISCLWPPCLWCMACVELPVYCLLHRRQVTKYTQ